MYEYNEKHLKAAGESAADFTLLNQDGDKVSLQSLLSDGFTILYFYSRDGAPGLAGELQDVNDYQDKFRAMGAKIVAISNDDVNTHAAYAKEHNITVPLLADPDQKVSEKYGVVSEAGTVRRTTFVVKANREIVRVFASRRVQKHIKEVYENIKRPNVN